MRFIKLSNCQVPISSKRDRDQKYIIRTELNAVNHTSGCNGKWSAVFILFLPFENRRQRSRTKNHLIWSLLNKVYFVTVIHFIIGYYYNSKMSALILQMINISYTGQYLTKRFCQLKKFSSQTDAFRFFTWLTIDFVIGYLASEMIRSEADANKLAQIALLGADQVVLNLRKLITWLMGAPAGLKLNSVLSMCLGRFFLYHIHLWVTFLHVATPYVSYFLTNYCLEALSKMGICMQLSLFQDAFNLLTFHIHCFYAYARRLFVSQSCGLMSLWRLFRGKKYNPLRDRVDTSSYNAPDQLFLGALAFTILLFLYPTTLMYFTVFKALEFVLTVINGLIQALSNFICQQAVPQEEIIEIKWID